MAHRPNFPSFMNSSDDYPVGSPDWSVRISFRVWSQFERTEQIGFRPFVQVLDAAIPGKPWQSWPSVGGTIESWSSTLFELPWKKVLRIVDSIDPEVAERLSKQTAVEAMTYAEAGAKGGRGKKASSDATGFIGRGTAYLAARLKRDRPDLLDSGMSIREAAKAAGIIKPPDPFKQLCRWWRVADIDQRAAFEEFIANERRNQDHG